MTETTLSSNIVNYLIWRYLQEAGFGNAALQLSRCWIRDPDTLPFAKNVEPHMLIRILQDGMCFDRLQAEATNTVPRYRFGADHGRPYSVRNGALLTLDKGIPAHELAAEANSIVQEPPAKKGVKRKKKPNGIEPRPEPDQNGEVVQAGPNGDAHATNSARAESEIPPSEAESPTAIDIPISTLSIGHDAQVQTELITDLSPQTLFLPRPNVAEEKFVQHTAWGPPESSALLAAGKSVLQVHVLDKTDAGDNTPSFHTVDLQFPAHRFEITALCWNSPGIITVSSREEDANDAGVITTTDRLVRLNAGEAGTHDACSSVGIVGTLKWNPEKRLLLSVSLDGERGAIRILKSANDLQPLWITYTETSIYDAIWISDTAFAVCGTDLLKIYEVGDSLTTQRTIDTNVVWEIIKYDPSSGIIATLGTQGQAYYLGILHPNDSLNLQTHRYPDDYMTDLDFRVRPKGNAFTNGSSIPSVLLATSSMTGPVRIWDANEPFSTVRKLPTTDDTQAFKVMFSPDGDLLAAAGPDAVTIWDLEKRQVPVASWRASSWPSKWNPGIDGEFNLGWSPDSTKLSIALGNQVAIIPIPQ